MTALKPTTCRSFTRHQTLERALASAKVLRAPVCREKNHKKVRHQTLLEAVLKAKYPAPFLTVRLLCCLMCQSILPPGVLTKKWRGV